MNDILHAPEAPPVSMPAEAARASAPREARDFLLVSGTDIFALGHYPGNPIYPGVLIADRLVRLAGTLAEDVLGQAACVAAIKRIQYLDAVLPGDVVELVASVKQVSCDRVEVSAMARVGDKPKARATLVCQPGRRAMAEVGTLRAMPPGEKPIAHGALAGILPHRYPFLLIDGIQDHLPGHWVRATKIVNLSSPLFMDGTPASYPPGLVIESIGQAGIALFFLSRQSQQPVDIVLGSVADTELVREVPFGSVMVVEARIERMLSNSVIFSGQASVDGQVVLRIGNMVAMVDPR